VKVKVSHPSFGQKITTIGITLLEHLTVSISGSQSGDRATINAFSDSIDGATPTYQWKSRPAGSSTWNVIGGMGTTSSPPQQKILAGTSVDFMCTLTCSDGRTDDSNVLTFSN